MLVLLVINTRRMRTLSNDQKQIAVRLTISVDVEFADRLCGRREKLELSTTEFKILCLPMESKGGVVTRERLMTEVWDHLNDETQSRTVDMHISTLRKKLRKGGDYLKTKRGVGYFIRDSESEDYSGIGVILALWIS